MIKFSYNDYLASLHVSNGYIHAEAFFTFCVRSNRRNLMLPDKVMLYADFSGDLIIFHVVDHEVFDSNNPNYIGSRVIPNHYRNRKVFDDNELELVNDRKDQRIMGRIVKKLIKDLNRKVFEKLDNNVSVDRYN